MFSIQEKPEGIVFKIFVQPRSSKNMIAGLYGDALKIKITSPPVDGAANEMCIKYLSKLLNLSKSSLEIIAGHTGRTKYILLKYTENKDDPEHLKSLIKELLKK